mmetsp:Transcript_56213/g.131653  ORF Transcript_56213/g.131653 Transcript_56213/m.131653 type:complete len:815 (-) Transcript_56213:15-2459(-)
MTAEEVSEFITELKTIGGKEAIVQTGGYYGVSSDIDALNTELAMVEVSSSPLIAALSESSRERAQDIFRVVLGDRELRNRNPLHPHVIDACLIGNLLDFPKHIFGFPFACFATDGNEALSLLLFAYRQQCQVEQPVVLIHGTMGESRTDLQRVADRLNIQVRELSDSDVTSKRVVADAIAVVTDLDNPALAALQACARASSCGLHVHVTDQQWRNIFTSNEEPVHYELPAGVTSMSVADGILNSAFMLYRETRLRDLHVDVPLRWQTAYFSPNEGGSCAGRLLFQDLCTVLLGWSQLAELATKMPATERKDYVMTPVKLPLEKNKQLFSKAGEARPRVLAWATAALKSAQPTDVELETELISLQRAFVGGADRKLDGMVTGGGTRSISLCFEAVFLRKRSDREPLDIGRAEGPRPRFKVLTGNPHLAVERASRRFGFDLVNLDEDGILSPSKLAEAISDPLVVAVYSQTLSFTDGISDPLAAILEVIETENTRRLSVEGATDTDLVVLINDCCLALNVLLQNDGNGDRANMRLLDLSATCKTPVLVTIDAHKHIGLDKGLSTILGSDGALSAVQGERKVGWQPTRTVLIRALADIKLIGLEGYKAIYAEFSANCDAVVNDIRSCGLQVIHDKNRIRGSSVVAVEDPSAAVGKKLKKLGHSTGLIYEVYPAADARCQSGWQLSFTPHHWRQLEGDRAIDRFLSDLRQQCAQVQSSMKFRVCQWLFKENSLLAFLLTGNIEAYMFGLLRRDDLGRKVGALMIRRFCSLQLDSGTTCTEKRKTPVMDLGQRLVLLLSVVITALLLVLKKRRRKALTR